ncbi:potassium channel family protein [Planococcus sp. ISL-110]|uniref:potassium channel family protein n=1 Tax=Planococcus sp. ISL-110 TaxID=2819167 RepID=UPI002034ED9D|nr:potassium channel family protein [Planococcus sp. ISL-110]
MVLGILLIVLCIVDFTWTTLWIDGGAGPVTDRLSSFVWRAFRMIAGDHSKSLSLAGPLVLSASLVMWIATLWIGWTLVFAGFEGSISPSHGNDPISWFDRIYFAGYLIFTLGNGDFAPTEGVWQIFTVLATGTGMLFITFGVTYLISILSAVTVKRSFAASIHGVGNSAEELVESAWNGRDFHDIDSLLNTYSEQLSTLTAQHIAYPVLHYYHAANNQSAMPTAVVVLDEALSIIKFGVPIDRHPNRLLLKEARSSVQLYLETLNKSFYKPSKNVPDLPDFTYLSKAGIPLVPDKEYSEAYEKLQERRSKLLGVIEADARPWPKQ